MSVLLLAWNNPIIVHTRRASIFMHSPLCTWASPQQVRLLWMLLVSRGHFPNSLNLPAGPAALLSIMFSSVNKRQDANTRASSLWWGLIVEGFFNFFISKKKITIRHPQMPLLMCHLLLIQSYPQRRSRIVLYSAFVVQENFILILLNTVYIKFPLKLFFLLNEKSNTNSFQLSVPLFSRSSAVF